MRAGKLDRRITLERFGMTYNEWNEPTSGWSELGTRWASKNDISDGEKLRAAQVGASVTTRFQVRYDSMTKTLTAADRLTCEGREYAIVGIKELGRREGIEITAATGIDTQVLSAEAPANEDDSQG
jgi:SPP1 family predicted phage head-tail adaptor